MNREYRVVLRNLATGEEESKTVTAPYERAVLCKALGGYSWPFRRSDAEHARAMAGVYAVKPPNQKYQLVSIERLN
jgi:hypothetical protein